ncbi:MAG: hypothetical protein COB16_17125 [Rhodobacteraceae bacterium]|nr:MAG: hypothetical protein COB16_17125 [Paracoccaceae bacterium]
MTTTTGLWLAVVFSGLYHGLNPAMGWPLAVSSALMQGRRSRPLFAALGALALGHFLAMLVILLPFSAMTLLVQYERQLRLGAGLIVIGLGLWLLLSGRHPRFLARVPPSRLVLWSFMVALVHGAVLMLVPIYLGLCRVEQLDPGHLAIADLLARNMLLPLGVAALHTTAMLLAGGSLALAVYRWLGLQFLTRSWFDLDMLWALSLIGVGSLGLYFAL